jgi:hypothetical protein
MEIYSRTATRTFRLPFIPGTPTLRELLQAITIYGAPVERGGTHAKVAICTKTAPRGFSAFFSYYLKDVNLLCREDRIKARDDLRDSKDELGREDGFLYIFSNNIRRTYVAGLHEKERERERRDRDEDQNPSNLCVLRYKAITVF